MNLKNYTSSVPASTSQAKIEKCLVAAGATDVSKKYSQERICIAIHFRLLVNDKPVFFQLPARVQQCFKVLWAEIKQPQAGTKERVLKQAEMTAWKIISDWVEVQLSMILLEQAEVLQIFLPYVYDSVNEKTFYEHVKEGSFKLLENKKS